MQNVIETINNLDFEDWKIYYENGRPKGFTVEVAENDYHVLYDGSVRDTDYDDVGTVYPFVINTLEAFKERR